ncbi:MAG: hypothetical protein KUG51_01045 [Urechidicola sp.]|nr:hypothetical protein [Urechidicola sp.]
MIKNFLAGFAFLICVQSFAQRTDSSPYASLGIGNPVEAKTVEEMSMGGVGTAGGSYHLNFSNPASYAAQIITTYTLALENRAYWFKDSNGSDNSSNGYLSYLGIGIPMGEKGGFAFGLQLNSTLGYSILNNINDADGELYKAALYEGNGGTNRVFFGAGYELFKGFSFGLEGNYIFGKTENTVVEQIRDVNLATKYKADARVLGFAAKAGVIYKRALKSGLFLNLGTSIEFDSELESNANEYLYSVSLLGAEIPRDTILDIKSNGIYKTPLKTNIGASIGNPTKWNASVDFSFRKEIELSGNFVYHNPQVQYESANRLSIGGFYIPRHNSISSYWERVAYRGGIRLEKTGLAVNGNSNGSEFTSINDFGISFGLGLPIGRKYSKLNTSFEYGKRGTTDNGLTKENYFNFRLGLSFGDKWFRNYEIN